jgi:hypothetical protein
LVNVLNLAIVICHYYTISHLKKYSLDNILVIYFDVYLKKCIWLHKGPCSSDEVYFTRGPKLSSGIGSCYRVKFNGKSRFEELNSVCADSSNRGSFKSPMSRRDPEINLLLGALHFLHITNTSDDKYKDSFKFNKC